MSSRRSRTIPALFLLTASMWLFPEPVPAAATVPSLLPPLLICGSKKAALTRVMGDKTSWEYPADGMVLDVQTQPSGRYLVVGGTLKAALVRKVDSGFRVIWDWSRVADISPQCAVAVDWGIEGDPSLILAGDVQAKRLFLAEAKSKGVKVRWSFPLPSPPRAVHVCPDNGNFLVVLRDSTVEEVLFREDRTGWTLGKESGLKDVRDAVRDRAGRTFVVDAVKGSVVCFTADKNRTWETDLPSLKGKVQDISISSFVRDEAEYLFAAVQLAGKEKGNNTVFLLDALTGKVVSRSGGIGKEPYPDFLKVVPDLPPDRGE